MWLQAACWVQCIKMKESEGQAHKKTTTNEFTKLLANNKKKQLNRQIK
jgi:hypothetical protein